MFMNIITLIILVVSAFVVSGVNSHKKQLVKDLTRKSVILTTKIYRIDVQTFTALHENIMAGLYALLGFSLFVSGYDVLRLVYPKLFSNIVSIHHIKLVGFSVLAFFIYVNAKNYIEFMGRLSKKYKFRLDRYKIVA